MDRDDGDVVTGPNLRYFETSHFLAICAAPIVNPVKRNNFAIPFHTPLSLLRYSFPFVYFLFTTSIVVSHTYISAKGL